MGSKGITKTLVEMKTILLSLLFPVILLPILFHVEGDIGRCTYAIILVILYWMFEVYPLPVTSLLPILLFPVLGVLTTGEACSAYIKNASMTFIGIFGIVAAVERWGLHRRIALGILILFGTKPHWLILGVLASTSFLSTFITAGVAVLMLPIVRGIMDKLESVDDLDFKKNEQGGPVEQDCTSEGDLPSNKHEAEIARLFKALSLCVAYGESLGSTATMTGSPSNMVMVGLTEAFYGRYGMKSPVTFISWFVFNLPMTIVIIILTWLWFVVYFLRGKGLFRCHVATKSMSKAQERVKTHLRQEYKSLGPLSYQETVVLASLILLVLLFLTQDFYVAPGWGSLFRPGFVGSSAPATLVLVLLFIIPSRSPHTLISCNYDEANRPRFEPIIRWSDVSNTTPWGLLLLFGAAFSIVKATQESGLMDKISLYFETFATLNPVVLTIAVTTLTTFATEFISNTATITMLVPIVGQLAILANMDPLSLIFPVTLAAKFAFMMPIATVANAVVFSLGALNIKDMAIAGFVVNVLTLLSLNIASQTWGKAYFGWDVLSEKMRTNITLTGNLTTSDLS